MVGPSLTPPEDPNSEYVPPADVLNCLPDARVRAESPAGVLAEDLIPGPVMRAAQIRDIRVLRGLLAHGFPPTNYIVGPLNNPWESALTNAILAGHDFYQHVKLLVEAGADPNGFPAACYRVASTRFLRGRKREDTWTAGCYLRNRPQALADVVPQLVSDPAAPLTEDEVQGRRKARSRFWAEHVFPRTDYPTNNPPSSLSAAIGTRNTPVYTYLTAHGADETAWTDSQTYPLLTDDKPSSYFVVESPMHVAVRMEDEEALQFLLGRGHKPDVFPMVLVTRCVNPVMATIAKAKPWLKGFDMLAPHADFSLLTPIFSCHLLHFAVATHSLVLVKHVIDTLGGPSYACSVAPTALGHTLLHVASLPIDDSVVTMHASEIHQSVHEFRTMEEGWEPTRLATTPPPTRASMRGRWPDHGSTRRGGRWSGRFRPTAFRDLSDEEKEAQAAVLLYLLDSGAVPPEQLFAQDVHGNTALHYLASVRNTDYKLIQTLLDRAASAKDITPPPPNAAGEGIWSGIKNIHGFTAKDLHMAGEAARARFNERAHGVMPFWDDDE